MPICVQQFQPSHNFMTIKKLVPIRDEFAFLAVPPCLVAMPATHSTWFGGAGTIHPIYLPRTGTFFDRPLQSSFSTLARASTIPGRL